MIYLEQIGYYLPSTEVSNFSKLKKFDIQEEFLLQKIGVTQLQIKNSDEETSDMCVKAYLDLQSKAKFSHDDIDCLVVCTQNPDNFGLPHTSAIVHDKLKLRQDCAVFDISLGCSGYVYGLSILKGFMTTNGFKTGILITADPYSKIIDSSDKNTSLLFGDAATATLLTTSTDNTWKIGNFLFGSDGSKHEAIHVDSRRTFVMNGWEVFNFTAKYIPQHIQQTLEKNNLTLEEVDQILLHQGSKYIVTTIQQKLKVSEEKIPFLAQKYGNTVSSSIPMLLKDVNLSYNRLLICGFGIGFSWGSCILERN